ncbi:MAG: hypothetical protein K6B14_02430 [Lachnospiraceae bacterium]|nr:hypothetical protein [Lachnospiraceae bacterium]
MEVYEISSDNAEEFLDILGEDVVDDMKRVFYRGIGVKDDDDVAMGAFVFELKDYESDKDTKSSILFAKSSSDEVTSAMLQYYKSETVYNEDIAESFYEFLDEHAADFCQAGGFTKVEKESDFVKLTLADVAKTEFAKKRKCPDYIKSISSLSVMQYRSAIKDFLFKGQKGILEDLAYLPMTWFDREISSCSVSDGVVDGLFLVRSTPSGILIPVFYYAYGQDFMKNLVYMLVRSILKAIDTRPPETPVWVCRSKKATRDLMARVSPGIKGEQVFFGERTEN